ncbi:MAG TPA: MopE-related protein [Spirochaetota bacterium]|nr:MopE-related protein [Spirochaetota bacterium]
MFKFRLAAIIAILTALSFASCEITDDDSNSDNRLQPLESITASITQSGGTIAPENGEWEIEFPAGAVSEPTEITVSTWPDGTKQVPEGYLSIFPVFELNPHGIQFNTDITLRINYHQGDMSEDGIEERLIGFYYLNDDGSLEKAESTVDTAENILEVKLPHFSFGIGLQLAVLLVNSGFITNEFIVQIIADRVVEELNSMTPEEREEFIEENSEVLGPFSDRLDDILPENPLEEIINPGLVFYRDADEDGFGSPDDSVTAVTAPAGYVADNTDCDDNDPDVNPAGSETIDGCDNDCNGMTDEIYFYQDADSDGYGNSLVSVLAETAPANYVADDTDCDDARAEIFPGAPEIIDGRDNDCDENVDEDSYFYQDLDNDGYGNSLVSVLAETAPSGYVSDDGDCDDTRSDVFPGATEIIDGRDNDCDEKVDEDSYFYQDLDNDGYGNSLVSVLAETAPSGYVSDDGDCDDTRSDVFPGATEIYDGRDNDCDEKVDENFYFYLDEDDDAYGNPAESIIAATAPAGYVPDGTDCDDTDPAISPGVDEIVGDGIDNNCDGLIDESYFYYDADGDDCGDPNVFIKAETRPGGYTTNNTDCNDQMANIYPGHPESLDGLDNDCDGMIDDTATAGNKASYIIHSGGLLSFKMVFVPGGLTFPTGTNNSTTATVHNAYWIAETEVTYELWYKVYTWATSGSGATGAGDYSFNFTTGCVPRAGNDGSPGSETTSQEPATYINWRHAMIWCNALTEWFNAHNGTASDLDCVYYTDSGYTTPIKTADDSNTKFWESGTGPNDGKEDDPYVNAAAKGFRLLTNNEWQCAARYIDGTNWTSGTYASGATADYNDATATGNVAVYSANSNSSTTTVKSKNPNALGLYDMNGNVEEWCFDWGSGGNEGINRLIRGGAYYTDAYFLQLTIITLCGPNGECGARGFRFARSAD